MLGRWGISLASADLRDKGDVLTRVTFDTRTVWPPKGRHPPGFDPQLIVEHGKNPGLGVRGLRRQGVTGKGVLVAIIDQPLLRGHSECKGEVAGYTPIDCAEMPPQLRGAAVARLRVGLEADAVIACLHETGTPFIKEGWIVNRAGFAAELRAAKKARSAEAAKPR
jgi:hypothetical protein